MAENRAAGRAQLIERLAAAILADGRRRMEGKSNDYRLRHGYYLLNISADQRALNGMYMAMKAAAAIHPADPPGDMDRLRWELGLMTDKTLAEMARYYPETKEDDAK